MVSTSKSLYLGGFHLGLALYDDPTLSSVLDLPLQLQNTVIQALPPGHAERYPVATHISLSFDGILEVVHPVETSIVVKHVCSNLRRDRLLREIHDVCLPLSGAIVVD